MKIRQDFTDLLDPSGRYRRVQEHELSLVGIKQGFHRAIFVDRKDPVVVYAVPRTAWRGSGPSRFAVDCATIKLLRDLQQDPRRERVGQAYIVLVDSIRPTRDARVVLSDTVIRMLDRFEHVLPELNTRDGNEYWWSDEYGNPITQPGELPF